LQSGRYSVYLVLFFFLFLVIIYTIHIYPSLVPWHA